MVLVCLFVTSCSYENESELFGEPGECNSQNVSYQSQVLPILESKCIGCHNKRDQTGGIVLEGHAEIIPHVNSGRFLGSIMQLPGYSPMPQGSGPISDCDIAIIESWIQDGSPNN